MRRLQQGLQRALSGNGRWSEGKGREAVRGGWWDKGLPLQHRAMQRTRFFWHRRPRSGGGGTRGGRQWPQEVPVLGLKSRRERRKTTSRDYHKPLGNLLHPASRHCYPSGGCAGNMIWINMTQCRQGQISIFEKNLLEEHSWVVITLKVKESVPCCNPFHLLNAEDLLKNTTKT